MSNEINYRFGNIFKLCKYMSFDAV